MPSVGIAASLGAGMGRSFVVVAALAAGFGAQAAPASAEWFPHPNDATWTYQWSDSVYNTTPTKEKVTVKEQKGKAFLLAWTTKDLENPDDAPGSEGLMAFQDTTSGVVNTDWQSTPPPSDFPILCPAVARCGNSMASSLYLLIWGTRAPVLAEPLLNGAAWASRGGADGDVTSFSQYQGVEQITVPAFPDPVTATKIRTDVTQAGALGDPYGSGVRTTWWVYGVGPVKVVFEHAGGAAAAITESVLVNTNQKPQMAPSDANYFPLTQGTKLRYRWTNTKHLKKPAIEEFTVAETANQSARVDVKHVSGPIRVAGSYGFALRTDGVTNIWGATQAASLAKFPPLGPKFLPANRRRHFFTPFDLMTYGMNPVLPAYPTTGDEWAAKSPSRDFSVFGVTGTTSVLGTTTVKVPAGTFNNVLVVRSTLKQEGFAFGSGTRTSYFAAGKGLVKLVFRHGDRSTSVVELLK
jgi:hypothetical protein